MDICVYKFGYYPELFNVDCETFTDYKDFKKSNKFKVIVYHGNNSTNIVEDAADIISKATDCDLLLIYTNELHGFHYNTDGNSHLFELILNNPKIYFVSGGCITDNSFYKSKTATNINWMQQCVDIYKPLPFKLAELNPYIVKPYYFDALLGSVKPHRDYVYNAIVKNNLQDKIITSYHNGINMDTWLRDNDVDYGNVPTSDDPTFKVMSTYPIDYYGKFAMVSHVIPFGVYNMSAYSIITETHYASGISFPTEKTAKPILAKRLFIAFSSQYHLRTLQELGFNTFSSVINEDYDNEPDAAKRFSLAWNAIEQLLKMKQQEIFEKVKPILEHNYHHLMNFPFEDFVKQQCTKILINRYYEST
jgi:hypothetical protein